jgi:excisionase family DNA binding protein
MPGDGEVVSLSEPLLDCVAVAGLLNVRVSWVRDAVRLGHLPCLRVGRHLRFTRAMLEDWLAAQAASTHAPTGGRGSTLTAGTSRPGFRRSTQAALLASLAEAPNARGAGGDG